MLKAVRFDLEAHEHLLTYIDNYRDSKGKPNYSEAIRMLMQKGYEAIHSTPVVEQKIEVQPVDVNSIKDQVYSEVMEELTKKLFSQMGSQPIIQQPEPVKQDPTPLPPKPKPVSKPIDTTSIAGGNGLLANLIGNANR